MPEGELYLLNVSPWSRKIRDVLRHTNATVTILEYHPIFTGLMLKLQRRFGNDVSKVTAPIYFPSSQDGSVQPPIMDGYLIAKLLDSAREPSTIRTLFPEEHLQLIEELCAAAEVCANFGRGYIFEELMKQPQMAAGILIPPLKWLPVPFCNFIVGVVLNHFHSKYMVETLEARKNGAFENALDTITNALKEGNGEFLVGDSLTYADIAVAYSLPFVHSTSSVWKSVGNHPIGDKYAELRSWGNQYFEQRK